MHTFKLTFASLLIAIFSTAFAADSPYKNATVVRAESSVVKEFNRYTFLESILQTKDGAIYTTSIMEGKIYKTLDGKTSEIVDIDGAIVGITQADDQHIIATGKDSKDAQQVLLVNTETGDTDVIGKYPQTGILNGILKLNDKNYLIADSAKGVIWQLDPETKQLAVWAEGELLQPTPGGMPVGANGIKKIGDAVYVSNTLKALVVKIPVSKNGKAKKPEIFRQGVVLDDFTMDTAGNIYGATHMFNSVIKVDTKGDVSIIAQIDQGVAGSTCVTWAYGSQNTLLVSANGGMLGKDPSQVLPANIVQLRLK